MDQLLDHLHDPCGALVRLVLHLRHRRRLPGPRPTLGLQEVVVRREAVQGLLEHLHGHGLVRHGPLELQVLLLAVLGGALEVQLELRDLRLRGLNAVLEGLDRRLELADVGLERLPLVRGLCRRHLVLVQLVLAEVVLLHLVLLLLLQHGDHVVDGLLDLREAVQLHAGRQDGQLRVLRLPRLCAQGLGHLPAHRTLAARGHLDEAAVGAAHCVAGLIRLQDLDRLGHGLHLAQAAVLPLVEVLAAIRAHRLQVPQELRILPEHLLLLLQVLLGLRQVVVRLRLLVLLLLGHLVPVLQLRLLRRTELCEGRGALLLKLLRLGELTLHLLLQLLQDTEDLAALRAVGREVRRALVRLHEGRRGLQGPLHDNGLLLRHASRGALLRRALGLRRLLQELVLEDGLRLGHCRLRVHAGRPQEVVELPRLPVLVGRAPREVLGAEGQERPRVLLGLEHRTARDAALRCVLGALMLREHHDRRLEVLQGLDVVLLHPMELRELLLPQGRRLVQRLLVRRILLLELLDGGRQLRAPRRQGLDRGLELLDLRRGGGVRGGLGIDDGLCPTRERLVEVLLFLTLGLGLR
mmetsp:Transcript_101464/g.284493  ORF Transcript_101464/g.284493 Transcript_101464/m.284493 type:complete len:580 (+) Transcript_101464:425-2164(+)